MRKKFKYDKALLAAGAKNDPSVATAARSSSALRRPVCSCQVYDPNTPVQKKDIFNWTWTSRLIYVAGPPLRELTFHCISCDGRPPTPAFAVQLARCISPTSIDGRVPISSLKDFAEDLQKKRFVLDGM